MNKPGFLKGGGEMGELICNFNWSLTSIGPVDKWPVELKNALSLMLNAPIAVCIMWGKDYIQFYNDAFIPSFGQTRHPSALGQRVKDTSQRWPEVKELFKKVMNGETIYYRDSKLLVDKKGYQEDCYFDISYIPIFLEDGSVGGIQSITIETTDKIKALNFANETANQLQFAIDAADLGTWELNPATNKFRGNTRLKEWFGLAPEEEIELSLATNLIAEKDRAKVNAAIIQALTYESGGNYDIEYTIQNPVTNKEIIVKAKGKAYFDKQKKPYTFSGTLQDVTEEAKIRKQLDAELIEQKRIYKQIEESEAHLQLIRDAVPAVIVYMDIEERYGSYNGVFMDWFHVNATEAIGKTTREFIGEESYRIVSPYLARAYAGEQVSYEMQAPQRIGPDKWLSVVYTPHKNNEGKVVGVIAHTTDITKAKQVERSLRTSELFSREIFYNSPVAKIVFTGIEMTIERVNENMLAMLGRDDSIVGKPFMEALPELLNTPLMDRLKEVFTSGKTYMQPEEKIVLLRFGKPYTGYFKYIYKPLISTAGEIYGIISTATEITEQVIARQIIEIKEKELRDIITASPIGMCVVSGNPVYVEEVNERFLLISGKTREQYANAPYWEVLSEVAHIFEPILFNVFKTGIKYTTEENEMVLVRDGVPERITITFEYVPVFDSGNKVVKVIVMVIEVTHQVETRKKIEEAVVARTKELAETNLRLKRSNEELEQFAYIASHDLQEPVRKISTFTQMLEHSMKDISEKSKDYISKIYNSTDRMTKLIRDVLAFSRIKEDVNNFEQVDLNKIINLLKSDYELQIEETNATIEILGLPTLEAVSTQMLQLFGNLMSNSLKYRKQGVKPVIKISASIAKPEKVAKRSILDKSKKYWHIEFTDNGIGFHKDHADRIFRIFQRLHGKNEFEGTGIGLAICLRIVQNHQGHISATVGENGGAVFIILLPEVQPHSINIAN